MATKKEDYIDKIAEQLKDWSAKIDELEMKTSATAASIKSDYKDRVRDLKNKRDLLTTRLKELKKEGGDSWLALKAGVDAAKNDLKESIATIKDKFKKAA